MEANQFEVLMLAITGLDTKLSSKMSEGFASVRSEMATGFASVRSEMATGFASVRQDPDVIRKQTATSVETLVDHESRIIHSEGPTS